MVEFQIDPVFEEMGITRTEPIAEGVLDIPPNHPIYKDIWRQIDEYTDKQYLVKFFEEEEGDYDETQANKKLQMLEELQKICDDNNFYYTLVDMLDNNSNTLSGENMSPDRTFTKLLKEQLQEPNPNITNEMIDYISEAHTLRKLSDDIINIYNKINNKFSIAIKQKYPEAFKKENHMKLEFPGTARIIINNRKQIRDTFQNLKKATDKVEFTLDTRGYLKQDKAVKEQVSRIFETFYGLRHNTKNGIYYFSNGEGMYIPFNKENLAQTYSRLHDKFILKFTDKNGNDIEKKINWTKTEFFNIAQDFCVIETESEKDVIGFPNCCYDSKEKKIYDLDYRLPHLPMKRCKINFVYHKNLDEQGGPLKAIFDYCFDEETKNKIFQHFGAILFERGYTESQSSLVIMGKGNCGKTTFIEALAKIFEYTSVENAGDFKQGNQFRFGTLPGKDMIVLDEITSVKEEDFIDTIKVWTGGGESITCNAKHMNPVQLAAEYIPRFVGIGNRLPEKIYKNSAGMGVLRRFDIIFLKNSILKAKLLTKTFKDVEYPAAQQGNLIYIIKEPTGYNEDNEAIGELYKIEDDELVKLLDKDGNPVIGTQGRTHYHSRDLEQQETLEWFLQQIILKYNPQATKYIDEEKAQEAFLKAYCSEQWVIQNHVEVHYTDEQYPRPDPEVSISAEELLKKIHKIVDYNMLEATISNPNSSDFQKLLSDTLNISAAFSRMEKNKKVFFGISFS